MTLICIDPGHAASTAGKRSPDGSLREYEFNRAVARRLAYHLERHGVQTMYSCNIDSLNDASTTARCKTANSANANLFISIHANAHGDGSKWTKANGWEIYYCKGSYRGEALAEAIQAATKPLGIVDRGVLEGSWDVIVYTKMPAVLIEHEFMTNLVAVEKLKSPEWRDKWAVADAQGILQYLGIDWIPERAHWAEKYLDSLVANGIINTPEAHRDSLDQYMTKGQIFAMLDRIMDK